MMSTGPLPLGKQSPLVGQDKGALTLRWMMDSERREIRPEDFDDDDSGTKQQQ
jgi:hypothetical protein